MDTVREALLKKGFRKSLKKGEDHEYYYFFRGDKKTSKKFKISHGAAEIRKDEIKNSANENEITTDDMFRIVSCMHSAEATAALLSSTQAEAPERIPLQAVSVPPNIGGIRTIKPGFRVRVHMRDGNIAVGRISEVTAGDFVIDAVVFRFDEVGGIYWAA